ncbi:MAG: hypothetical protein A2287_08920 [Candidatus Melainabacteria bacterium RIFOXYA12_FULL_32_12]|nr:MAG: hypothetical protein A2255_02055 [Candidatus Melainabacteria bacterium RIFOXYA2_FULL_32_9]OGI26515.1 MAG: hypothetical protein A2287_08920 [Candidatus Melainabacteria bacterium RIFOXYA12_FULL_32_12]
MTIKLVKKELTIKGNEIQLFKAESHSSEKGKTILFIGVFHGDEPEGEPLILNLMNEITNNPAIINGNIILFIPVLNPDGKELNTRGNANGVDLNRNFPTKNWELSSKKDEYYSGEFSASELETRFLTNVIDEYKPDVIITLHTPYRIVNYDGPAKELAEKISRLNGYPVQEDIGYPTPGSFGSYAGIERGIPVITLELPDNVNIEQLWQENKAAFSEIIRN